MKARRLVSMVGAVAVAAQLIPTQSVASTGLFRVKRLWWGSYTDSPYISADYHPRLLGPNKAPPAYAYIGYTSPAPRFTAPSKFIVDYTRYRACVPSTCFVGYPESKAWYSYWNLKGSFRPNNSQYGGASTTTTVRFDTTMGDTGPPLGTGEPVTPTTTFGGRYDFSRGGSIMLTPGANRFGGTMQFFYGPNHRYYNLKTLNSYISKGYGYGQPAISAKNESRVGDFVIGRQMNHYRMTSAGYQRWTTGNGDYYIVKAQYISTIVPFTTGRITGYQPVGQTITAHTLSGYDNRTPAGFFGVISMVRPRLVHQYLVPYDSNDPIRMGLRSSLRTWQLRFHFIDGGGPGDGDGVADWLDNCSERPNAGQDDTDQDGCGNLCDADYDQNGIVGFPDFGAFVAAFGTTDEEKRHVEPVSGGVVGFPSFGFFVANFGATPGPSGTTTGTTACP